MADLLYGFNRQDAKQLKRMARVAGLKPSSKTTVKYPKPIPDDTLIFIGKTDAQITKSNSGNVSRYKDDGVTQVDTGETDAVIVLFATVAANKWIAYARSGSFFYAIAAEC